MLTNKNKLIAKYLSGNTSAQETKELMDWLKLDPSNQQEFDRAQELWIVSLNLKNEKNSDVESAWEEFKVLRESQPHIKAVKKESNWLKIAAALTLLLVTSVLIKILHTERANLSSPMISEVVKPTPEEVETGEYEIDSVLVDSADIETPTRTITKRTRKFTFPSNKNIAMISISSGDSVEIFQLPDNSIVYLNANSKLEYPQNFNKTNRRVSLIGEAYFDIKKDSGQFVVACENTIIRGKATTFNVKSYSQDKQVEVIVASGVVEFSGIGYKDFKKLTIESGESAYYDKAKSNIIKSKHQRKNYKWWQNGNLRAKIKDFFDKLFGRKK